MILSVPEQEKVRERDNGLKPCKFLQWFHMMVEKMFQYFGLKDAMVFELQESAK